MLFKKRSTELRRIRKMNPVIFLPLAIAIVIALTSCGEARGSIIILENRQGTGCEMEFKEWSAENKCELTLHANDKLEIEIACESGSVSLDIRGKSGVKAYMGSGLETGSFTVQVPEAGEYIIAVKGRSASGRIDIKNLSR
jgi:hypothetical protein